ncbi:MAG: GntR family transcriptional regulator, partial [Proteobacteria bacterium]|nr:GntR family transcriptional regulator [Pseudomonadota bacterium]
MNTKDITINLNRETLVDRIVDILEGRILTGELKPTAKLSEARVAKEFGVSRVPAREALQRLQEMNLVRKTRLGREVAKF